MRLVVVSDPASASTMMHSLCLRHVALAAAIFMVMNVETMGRDEEDRARGEDVTVFVNANILKLQNGDVTVKEKLGIVSWEECASACSESECCTGFVFHTAEHMPHSPFGTCQIIEGSKLDPPSTEHLETDAVSGLLKAHTPPECAQQTTQPSRAADNVTLVVALIVHTSFNEDHARTERSLHDIYWHLIAVLELRVPLVLITQSILLPRLLPLLHTQVRVVLVRESEHGLLQPEVDPSARPSHECLGPHDQEPSLLKTK